MDHKWPNYSQPQLQHRVFTLSSSMYTHCTLHRVKDIPTNSDNRQQLPPLQMVTFRVIQSKVFSTIHTPIFYFDSLPPLFYLSFLFFILVDILCLFFFIVYKNSFFMKNWRVYNGGYFVFFFLLWWMNQFHQYQVVGRGLPTETDEHPKIYRMKLWATNEVRAKSKFWYVSHITTNLNIMFFPLSQWCFVFCVFFYR